MNSDTPTSEDESTSVEFTTVKSVPSASEPQTVHSEDSQSNYNPLVVKADLKIIFVKLLEKNPVLSSTSKKPATNKLKQEALDSLRNTFIDSYKIEMSTKQIKKKIENLKSRAIMENDSKMTGNVKPLLTDVTSKLIDILHGELPSENPSVSRIPRAQFTTPVKKQAANPQKFSMTSVDDLLHGPVGDTKSYIQPPSSQSGLQLENNSGSKFIDLINSAMPLSKKQVIKRPPQSDFQDQPSRKKQKVAVSLTDLQRDVLAKQREYYQMKIDNVPIKMDLLRNQNKLLESISQMIDSKQAPGYSYSSQREQ